MQEEIIQHIENPHQLEKLYRKNKTAFKLGYKPKDNAEKYSKNNLSKNEYVSKIALKFQGGVFVSNGFNGIASDIK